MHCPGGFSANPTIHMQSMGIGGKQAGPGLSASHCLVNELHSCAFQTSQLNYFRRAALTEVELWVSCHAQGHLDLWS